MKAFGIYILTAGCGVVSVRMTLAHPQECHDTGMDRGSVQGKGIPYAVFDAKPAFDRCNALIKEDKIDATPTCVVIKNGQKKAFVGAGHHKRPKGSAMNRHLPRVRTAGEYACTLPSVCFP